MIGDNRNDDMKTPVTLLCWRLLGVTSSIFSCQSLAEKTEREL